MVMASALNGQSVAIRRLHILDRYVETFCKVHRSTLVINRRDKDRSRYIFEVDNILLVVLDDVHDESWRQGGDGNMVHGEYPGMNLEGGATGSRTFSYLIISTSIQCRPWYIGSRLRWPLEW